MVLSKFGYKTPIPFITSKKAQTKPHTFTGGVDTYKDNDDLDLTELTAAIDARFVKKGRYKTRKGLDRYSVPIGEAVDVQQTSTTGASLYTISETSVGAQKLTIATGGRITKVDVRLKTQTGARGTVLVELYDNNSGTPGTLLGRSSIAASSITSSFAYLSAYFVEAPLVSSSDVIWVVVKGQTGAVLYAWSTTTNATNAKVSTDSGVTFSSAAYDFNVKLYTSTDGGVKGLYRAYRPNGTKVSMFWHKANGYTINDTTRATTSFHSGLSSSAVNYRAQMVQDAVYYVNGIVNGIYKYDFSTTSTIAVACTPTLIVEHKGILFVNDTTDTTKVLYSNFANYSTWTSTDFLYVPAPKSYDGLTAFAKLNGILYFFAKRNKFQLFGSDNTSFTLDEATSQRGTFSQESVVFDANYIFHADEEGIWQFNGTDERNLAEHFLEDYLALDNKDQIQLELRKNRLYVFHPEIGNADVNNCFVINLQLGGLYESLDKGTIVGRTFSRYAQDDIFLQASNRVGAVYYGEQDSNDYCNLGDQLQWELDTAFNHFGSPGQLHWCPMWRPKFTGGDGQYSVSCGYAKDYADDATYQTTSLSSGGSRFDTGVLFDSGATFAQAGTEISPTDLLIPGEFKRLQRRYRHIAAREPVEMTGEVLQIEEQDLI